MCSPLKLSKLASGWEGFRILIGSRLGRLRIRVQGAVFFVHLIAAKPWLFFRVCYVIPSCKPQVL